MTAARANTNDVPSASAAAIDKATGLFSGVWYRYLAGLNGAPQAAQSVALSGSPMAFTAPSRGNLAIMGGAVSALALARGRVSIPVSPSAAFVPASLGDVITLTFTGTPTLTFFPA